uniref:Glycerate kinase n=1 Tax=Eubacterium cellulosolvens (strain ATCC 43171 / JCM 9499 / 6) TaxID=633697 RepID=I5ATZ1_EUBC6
MESTESSFTLRKEKRMKVTVAIDSMKGSLGSVEAGEAIRRGILLADKSAEVRVCPIADGGEGTVEALTSGLGGNLEQVFVTGPLGAKITARYGILPEDSGFNGNSLSEDERTDLSRLSDTGGKTAVIEMAAAAGITLIGESERNPLCTTTYGVGEMIRDAIKKGCRHFIVGIGGSATNDGGIGMLQALGFGLLDEKGNDVPFGAQGLKELRTLQTEEVLPELAECRFRVACDVNNPLCGENGCSAVFGPQKGATPEMIEEMDRWLASFAELAREIFPKADPSAPGSGAAGGLGFAFRTFTNAVLESGIKIVLEETKLEDFIRDSDLVITGEGRLDSQTAMGKAPIGVAKIAKKYDIPVIAFAGAVAPDAGICNAHGIDAFFPILRRVSTLEEAMEPEAASRNLTDTAEQVMRLYLRARR